MISNRIREILYCDDTEEQRYAMRRILERAGYTVIEAATGAEALEKLHAGVLVVVLDVKLPDISGFEVCRRMKENPVTAGVPILQISASFADPALRAQGLQGGADAYVAQPVHAAELLSLVAALIRSHESERTLRFQAEVSRQLALSLEHKETLAAIERVFVPRFADRCRVLLRGGSGHASGVLHGLDHDAEGRASADALPGVVVDAALEVSTSGHSRLFPAGSSIAADGAEHKGYVCETDLLIIPLGVGRKQLGALVFMVDGEIRHYQMSNLSLAQDLADRAALALQNATLFTAQRVAQAALVQSEKLAAAGRLSAAIAHEINNPLESITNLMYLIDTSDEITPSIKGYVQEALSELSRLTHIARQSLGFYRELTGPQLFDLNDSVDDTLNIYLKRFDARRIEIERRYAPGRLEISAVKGEVRQVISNLLVNAYDALPEQGRLLVETRRLCGPGERMSDENVGQGSDEASGPGCDRVAFRVTDNGSGIARETLPQIFEPFFTTKQGTGTGLGLWVSDTIVTKHGGTIAVTTRTDGPEKGTTFEVVLPLHFQEGA